MRALLGALMLMLAACWPGAPRAGDAPGGVLDRPRLAPTFSVRTLDGHTLELAALTAKGPVVLDFWATWCKPCIASLPELEVLHERYAARGLTVLGISVDGPRNFARVRPFVNKLGLRYPIALDEDGTLQERYQVAAMPTTVVISRDGRMKLVHQGYDPSWLPAVAGAIASILGPDSTATPPDSIGNRSRGDASAPDTATAGGAR